MTIYLLNEWIERNENNYLGEGGGGGWGLKKKQHYHLSIMLVELN